MRDWFWRPNHDTNENHGDYIYAGPETHQRYWYGSEMSPRLTETEFSGMWAWAGVHINGRVMKCNGPDGSCKSNHTAHSQWSGKRVPLMVDSFLIRDWVSGLKTYPHFPNPAPYDNTSIKKGRGNVMFNDASVETYPHSY